MIFKKFCLYSSDNHLRKKFKYIGINLLNMVAKINLLNGFFVVGFGFILYILGWTISSFIDFEKRANFIKQENFKRSLKCIGGFYIVVGIILLAVKFYGNR